MLLLVATPFALYGYWAIVLPKLNDVTTDLETPPSLGTLETLRAETPFPTGNISDVSTQKQLEGYPSIAPRRYRTSITRVAEAVADIVEDRNWRVISEPDGEQAISAQTAEEAQAPDISAGDGGDAQATPTNNPSVLRFEVVASSLFLRLPTDVVIRITDDDGEALVDLRAANRYSAHDFGTSAAIIESFLADLDGELLGVAGELPAAE